MKCVGVAAVLTALLSGNADAQGMAASAPSRPQVVALVAMIGDLIEVVRQRESTGGNLEPLIRSSVHLQTQTLNDAARRGLDQAMVNAEPDAKRIAIPWVMSEATTRSLETAHGAKRDEILLDALITDLRAMPERRSWDRIEFVVPDHSYNDVHGGIAKLSGVGVFVQPLPHKSVTLTSKGDSEVSNDSVDGGFKTVDPNTGNIAKSSIFVAPYAYLERITIDAHTLAVIARTHMFESIKYFDPNSIAIDVSQQMPFEQVMEKLDETVERAAYKSVRDVRNEVRATTPVEQPR